MMTSAPIPEGPVRLTVSGPVATLTWSRPNRRNAIGLEICGLLTAELEQLAQRADIAAIHLDSADGPFCAGFDLTDLAALDTADTAGRRSFFAAGRGLMAALAACPQVLIAGPRHYALGFGCAVLARCDAVIAPDDATFGIPEIRAGVVPTTVLPELLSLMPARTVLSWALDGQRRSAHEAHAANLVTTVVPADLHDDQVRRVLSDCAERASLVRETKSAVRDIVGAPVAERAAVAVRLAERHAAMRAAAGARP